MNVEKVLDTRLRDLLGHPNKEIREAADKILKALLREHEVGMFPDKYFFPQTRSDVFVRMR